MPALLVILVLLLSACSQDAVSTRSVGEHDLNMLAMRGERLYQNACTSCHNSDPTLAGSLGPAVAGSSYELLEARVLHAGYPEGYSPKQNSAQMLKMPQFKSEIPALESYLNSLE